MKKKTKMKIEMHVLLLMKYKADFVDGDESDEEEDEFACE